MNLPRTLSEHEVLIFVLQFALLLGSARLLGELMKRLGQAMVLGELLAGMLLGPSVLGALSPKFYQWIFPAQATQIHLLELMSFLGMIFLLVSSGIETDLKILKNGKLNGKAQETTVFLLLAQKMKQQVIKVVKFPKKEIVFL